MNYPKMMCSKSSAVTPVGAAEKRSSWPEGGRCAPFQNPQPQPPIHMCLHINHRTQHGPPQPCWILLCRERQGAATPPPFKQCRSYKIRHFFFLFSFRVVKAARVACSNTSRTPSFVFAEHSRYLSAPIFLRTSSACACISVVLTDRRAEGYRPARGSQASGKSCGAPQSSSGRSEDPSCSRRG